MSSSQPTDTLKDFKIMMDGNDVSGLAKRVTLRQSLDQPFLKATFDFADTKHVIPASSAGKNFEFTFTPQSGSPLKSKLIVEKFDDTQVSVSGKSMQGSLRCVSEEFKNAMSERVTKSYEGETADSVVQKITKEHLKSNKKVTTDKTNKLPGPFLANKQKPFDVIEKARGLPQNGEPHQFYEDVDGFNFKSIDKMIKQGPAHKLQFNHAAYASVGAANDPNNILDCVFNYGGLGDVSKANKAQDTLYSYETGQQKDGDKANKYSPTESRQVSGVSDQKHNRPFAGTAEQYKDNYKKDKAKADQKYSDLTAKTKILLTLRPDIKPGQVIDVNLAGSGSGHTDGGNKNSHSGKWLVSSVVHVADFTDGSGAPYGRTIVECVGKIA